MLENFLSNIDLIGIPVSMNLFGREKVKTRFGGICSIFIFGFVIWAIYNASQDLFSTLNPKIVSYDFFKDDPRAITLSRESFPFGFAIQAPESLNYMPFKDPSIFTIQITHSRVDTIHYPDGSAAQQWTVSEIKTEKCPQDYFSGQASSLGDMNLNSVYCIAEDQPELDKLEIQGIFSSPVYQSVSVGISMCDNSTSNNTCAPQKTINKYLDGAWFNMVYINMVVNPQNYTHPNNTYKDIYSTVIDPNSYRESDVNLGYVEISTDSGWFTEDYRPKAYTKVNQINEYISTTPHPDKLLILCSLTVDQLETYYTRSYKKIQSVLAEVAGVANLALIIMTLATGPFMRIKFRESLINGLFEFRIPQHPNAKLTKKTTLNPTKKHKKGFKLKIRQNTGTETNNIVLTPHKTEVVTNLNSSHDYRDYMPAIKSPLFSEQATLFDSPTHKDSNPPNDSPTKLSSPDKHILTDEMIRNHRNLNQRNSLKAINTEYIVSDEEIKPDEIYEGKKQKIKSSLNLESRIRVKNKRSRPHIKSLRDEDSLHLSFDSDIESSDREPSKKNNHKDPQASEFDKDRDSEMRNIQENVNQDTKEKVDNNVTRVDIPSKTSSFVGKTKGFQTKGFQKLDVSIWQYISWLVLGPKSQKQKKKVFEEGLKQVNERLDIINVMKKLRELDKFRALLLDPDQLLLFNNMPKPVITSDNESLHQNLSNSYMQLQSLKFVDEAIADEQIGNSINNLKNKVNKTEIDKRLIEIFEGQDYQGV